MAVLGAQCVLYIPLIPSPASLCLSTTYPDNQSWHLAHHGSVELDRARSLLDLVLLLTVNFTFTGSICSLEDGSGSSVGNEYQLAFLEQLEYCSIGCLLFFETCMPESSIFSIKPKPLSFQFPLIGER